MDRIAGLALQKKAKTQRTPAFVHALILSTLGGGDNEKAEACGGFTDVGKHTGNEPRETCWPLVREVLKVISPKRSGGNVFRRDKRTGKVSPQPSDSNSSGACDRLLSTRVRPATNTQSLSSTRPW